MLCHSLVSSRGHLRGFSRSPNRLGHTAQLAAHSLALAPPSCSGTLRARLWGFSRLLGRLEYASQLAARLIALYDIRLDHFLIQAHIHLPPFPHRSKAVPMRARGFSNLVDRLESKSEPRAHSLALRDVHFDHLPLHVLPTHNLSILFENLQSSSLGVFKVAELIGTHGATRRSLVSSPWTSLSPPPPSKLPNSLNSSWGSQISPFTHRLLTSFASTSSPSQAPTTLRLPQLVSGPSDFSPGGFRGRLIDWNKRRDLPLARWLSVGFPSSSFPLQVPTIPQPLQHVQEPPDFVSGGFRGHQIDWDIRQDSPLARLLSPLQLVLGPPDLVSGGFRGHQIDWDTRQDSPLIRTFSPLQLALAPPDFASGGFRAPPHPMSPTIPHLSNLFQDPQTLSLGVFEVNKTIGTYGETCHSSVRCRTLTIPQPLQLVQGPPDFVTGGFRASPQAPPNPMFPTIVRAKQHSWLSVASEGNGREAERPRDRQH
ncbi:hypothetical protein BDN72DRAFT_906027 [Pluteus cervinus]|uniref:Uncharacterized protein n=1 Tax=Pluteus cervinus TaxID=181527 RepID=A0ACD3A0C7_9AGAR|nr:hypothetical protein BDN72DRAFT_906027 [Pluteus cervinus]